METKNPPKNLQEIYTDWAHALQDTKTALDEIQLEAEKLKANHERDQQRARLKDMSESLSDRSDTETSS